MLLFKSFKKSAKDGFPDPNGLSSCSKICHRWSGRTSCGGTIGGVMGPLSSFVPLGAITLAD